MSTKKEELYEDMEELRPVPPSDEESPDIGTFDLESNDSDEEEQVIFYDRESPMDSWIQVQTDFYLQWI